MRRILILSLVALVPFWLKPLDPPHDVSFQLQAGYDLAKHGTLYHQWTGEWPLELSRERLSAPYDKVWLKGWPPGFSLLVAAGVLLGNPVLWIKAVFTLMFVFGWCGWFLIARQLAEDARFRLPGAIVEMFPFLPLLVAIESMGIFPRLVISLTDWMVFLLVPFWYLNARRYAASGSLRALILALVLAGVAFHIKFTAAFLFIALGFLVLSRLAACPRRLNGVRDLFVCLATVGIVWLPLMMMPGKNRAEAGSFADFFGNIRENLPFTVQEMVKYVYYDLLQASGLGSIVYGAGYHIQIIHQAGRAAFLCLVVFLLVSGFKHLRQWKGPGGIDDDSKTQLAAVGGLFLFLSFVTALSGRHVSSVIGPWSYLREYRYVLPVTLFVFFNFWRWLLAAAPGFKHLLRLAIILAAVQSVFNQAVPLAPALAAHGLRDGMSLYSREDYAIQGAMVGARDLVSGRHPGLKVICFRFEIDRGFDRYGPLLGYELRKEIVGRPFNAEDPIIVLLAIPTERSPKAVIAPRIDLSRYRRLEGNGAADHEFYYRIEGPGTFNI